MSANDAIELKAVQEAAEKAVGEIKTLVEKQMAEIRATGETTKATAEALAKAEKSLDQVAADYKGLSERLGKIEAKGNRPGFNGQEEVKTAGQQFIESEIYKSYIEGGARGESRPVVMKDITGGPSSAGPLLTPFLRQEIFRNPDQPLFVSQLVQTIPVNTDAVQIFRELLFTNNAGWQPGQLGTKPKSDITFESDTLAIQTLAHYIIASRQILADVQRMRSYIDNRLWYGLQLVKDTQILYGDGTGQNFTGMFVDPAVTDIGGVTPPTSGATQAAAMIDHFRSGITALQKNNYYNVTGAVMSPDDWQTIETAKGSDGHYVWVSVQDGGTPRLWRVPVIVSNAIQDSDFILGDFNLAATLYQREGYQVRLSEHHANLFVQNGVAILGEERLGFGIELPLALVKGTFEAGS